MAPAGSGVLCNEGSETVKQDMLRPSTGMEGPEKVGAILQQTHLLFVCKTKDQVKDKSCAACIRYCKTHSISCNMLFEW